MRTFGQQPGKIKAPLIRTSFIFFVIIIFFYSLGDSIMSFMAPNLIEGVVKNPLLMGIIFSFSSFVGLMMDFLLSNSLKERSVFTYSFLGIVIAIAFPLVFLLKTNIVTALIAMGIWGIYYELILFAKSNYVHHHLNHDQHDLGWAFFSAFSSLAYLIGPTFALSIMAFGDTVPLLIVLVMQGLALLGLIVYKLSFQKGTKGSNQENKQRPVFLNGFRLWKTLNTKLYPVLIYLFLLNIVDATFWTMGAILSATHSSPLANMFYVIYLLPAFVVAPLGIRLSKYIGKKRTAFIGGLFAGTAFGISIFVDRFEPFMLYLGIGSIFFAVTIPEIRGAIEDYCERLGHNANTLVGLTSSMGSLGYIIGPILSGAIASMIGDQKTFGVIGWMLALASLFFLLTTPRKLRLPQKEITFQTDS